MNLFISNIISRHLNPNGNVNPRLPGIFEPRYTLPSVMPHQNSSIGYTEEYSVNKARLEPENISHDQTLPGEDSLHTPDKKESTSLNKSEKPFFNEQNQHSDEHASMFENIVSPQNLRPSVEKNIPKKDGWMTSGLVPLQKQNIDRGKFVIQPNTAVDVVQTDHQNILNSEKKDQLMDETQESKFSHPALILPSINNKRKGRKTSLEDKLENYNNMISPSFLNTQPLKKDFAVPMVQNEVTSVIKISIGRVEVKAITSSDDPKPKRNSPSQPKMSLEDYLKERNSADK